VLPSRNYAQPQIVYYPQPPNPPVPVEKVFAMAVILGMGAVGLTAGVIGLLKVSDTKKKSSVSRKILTSMNSVLFLPFLIALQNTNVHVTTNVNTLLIDYSNPSRVTIQKMMIWMH
jgi:hypothetical protein